MRDIFSDIFVICLESCSMKSKDRISQGQDNNLSHVTRNFLGGALLGLVPLILAVLYCGFLNDSMDWNTLGTKFLVVLPVICGILSAAFGNRFISALEDFMSYLG
jgi:hypothetical protein